MSEEEFSNESLKKSSEIVGPLYEVIVAEDDEVLDGKHRLEVNPNWPKRKIPAKTRTEKILVRLNANYRRRVPKEETQALILELAHELEKSGVLKENISSELANKTPFGERWIRELLPQEYKKPEKVEAAKAGAELLPQKEAQIEEEPHPVQCSCCPNGTLYPKDWQGKLVCPSCFDKLSRGEITLEAPKPEAEPTPIGEGAPKPTLPRVERRVYEPGAFREEMHKPVSRMDEWVAEELSRLGIPIEIQQPICIKFVVPEVTIKKGDKPLAVFLDHPDTHAKRTLVDMENRELLAKRGCRVLELQYDAYTEEQRQLIMSEILSAIQ